MSSFTSTKSFKISNLFTGIKLRILPVLALMLALIVGLSGLNAQILTFNFTGTAPSLNTPWTSTSTLNANLILTTGVSLGAGVVGANTNNRVSTTGYNVNTTLATAITGNNYINFKITPAQGYNLSLAGKTIVFTVQTSSTGVTDCALLTSIDGFTTSNVIGSNGPSGVTSTTTLRNVTTTGITYTFGNGAQYSNITSTVEFRFYAYNASGSGGTFSLNACSLNGTLAACTPLAATGLSGTVGDTKSTVSWTNPSCFSKVMLVAKATSFTSATPSGSSYTVNSASFTDVANTAFDGGVVLYYGTGNSVNVTGLTNGTTYNLKVFTQSVAGTWSAAATGSASPVACSSPTAVTGLSATNANAQSALTWTNPACYDNIMVVASSSSFTSAAPSGTSYTAHSASFADGANSTFDGGVVVFYGNATTATITGLTNGTTYNFKVYTVKGSTWNGTATATASPYLPAYYWNGGNTSANPAAGGTGTWNTANAWIQPTASGTSATWSDGNNAVFAGTAGTVTLDASKSTTGTYFNTQGYILQAGATSTLTGPIYLNFNSGSAPYTLTVKPVTYTLTLPNGISTIGSNTGTVVLDGGSLGSTNYAILSLTGASQTISTPITVQATGNTAGSGTVGLVVSATGTYNVTGNITNNANTYLLLGGTSGGTLTVSGQISSSTYGIMYANKTAGGGAAPLYLNHDNNYTGSTLINGGGTNGLVSLGTDGALPSTTDVIMGYTNGNGGFLDINGHNPTINSISSVIASNTVGVTNGAAGTGTNTLTIAGSTTQTLSVPINNGATAKTALAITGAGTLIQSQASTFSGGLSIAGGGTFQAGVASVLTNTPALTLNNGTFATGAPAGTGYSTATGSLMVGASGGTISLGTASHTLTIASSSGNTWGAGNLTVNGWTRAANTASASAGKIIITSSGLTATQLGKISFTGFSGHAIFNPSATTELIPDYVDASTNTNFGTATYNPASNPATLSVAATCNSAAITGTATYQWFSSLNSNGSSPTSLGSGARTAYYIPSITNGTSSPITTYYFCVITYNGYTYTTTVSGAIIVNPSPAINVSSLSGASNLTYLVGNGPSAIASFTVSATYLTGGVGTITIDNGSSNALSYFELSTNYVAGSNPGTWSGTATINYSSATLTSTTVYVRLAAGQSVNNSISETYISVYGGGATTSQSGFLNGSVTSSTPPVITGQPSFTNNTTCNSGTAISVTVTPGTDANPAYQWWYNTSASTLGAQVLTANANAASYTPAITSQTTAGIAYYYYCTISDSYSNLATSDFSGAITINAPIAAASVSIVASNTTICSGSNVTFTATPTTNGGTPSYQWYLNNGSTWNAVGTNSNQYSTTSLTDQNQVKVFLTPTGGCLTDASAVYSNSITETVPATETASFTISGNTAACISKSISFTAATPTATPSNTYNVGGAGATYDWYLNTVLQSAHTNTFTYTTGSSATTDNVYAKLHTATGVCVSSNLVTSTNSINVLVSAAVPTVTTTATGVVLYPGFTSTFAATASGSGTLSYQWNNNGVAITNNTNNGNTATTSNYTANSNDLTNNASVTCTVTSSLGCSATASGITVSIPTATAFTPGNIVVERVGDGVTNNAANAGRLFVDQFAPTGASQSPISSSPLPYSVGAYSTGSSSTTNFSLTTSANATSEGYMTLSADGKFLAVPGYNAPIATASIATTATSAPSTNYRAAGVVYGSGIATVPLAADFQSGNNLRSVVSDGTSFWFSGASGFYYFSNLYDNSAKTYGSVNTRTLKIYNGSIYGSSASGSNVGINFVDYLSNLGDNGTTAAMTLLTPVSPNNAPNANGFVMNPTGDVIYVADGTNGIMKFTYNGTIWSKAYTLNTTTCLGITGIFTGTNPVIYATSSTGAPSKLFSVTDAGNPGTATTTSSNYTLLSTSASTCVYKGVALAPSASQTSYIYANTSYQGNNFGSGAFSNTYANSPTTAVATGNVNYFAIAGIFLNNSVTITPDAGFEVSLDPSFGTYSTNASPLTISAATFALTSTTSTQVVYVRFKPTTAGTTYSGTNIKITSTGAAEIDIPVSGTSNAASDYYYVGTGDLSLTSNWTNNSNLSGGTPPPNMSTTGITWHLNNTKNISLSTAWSLGTNARIIVGDATHTFNLTVPSGDAITGGLGIEVANASSLIWQDASSSPIFTVLDDGSTVNYAAASTQLIRTAAYSNLTLSGTGSKTFSGSYSINKTFNAGTSSIIITGSTITFNGTIAQTIPGITYDALTVSNAAGATLSGNATAGNLTINAGTLYVPVNKYLSITGTTVSLSSSSSALDIAGTFNNGSSGNTAATITQATGSTINCNYTTTVYNHLGNGGSLPKASWNASSTCSVTGITSINPTSASFTQNFGKFNWNNSGQTTALNINTSSFGTQGLLDIEGTGTSYIALASGLSNTYSNSINSLTVNNAKFYTCVRSSSITPTVTLTIAGNINISGTSTVDLANGTAASAANTYATTLNAGGNIIVGSSATFVAGTNNSTVNGAKIVFTKSGAQTYSNASSTGKIDYIINATSTVTLGSNLTQITTAPGDFINNNGVINLGGYLLTCNNINSSTNTSSGLIAANNGSITINGTTANTLVFRTTNSSDTLLGSLVLSGTGKVSLGSGIGISSLLNLSNSAATLDINGHYLTLKSNATKTAEFATLTGTAAIVDGTKASPYTATNITVERFIPQGMRNYRDLGPSVANAGTVFKNWQENGAGSSTATYGVYITGKTGTPGYASYDPTSGFDYTTNGNNTPSLYSCLSGNWSVVTTATGGTKGFNLDPFQGLRMLVRGSRNFNMGTNPSSMPTATTLRATGTLVTGTVTYNAIGSGGTVSGAYTSAYGLTPQSAYTNGEGWSFVANPYACPISWSLILANTGTNVGNTYYFLDPTYQNAGVSRYTTVQYNGSTTVVNRPSGVTTDAACLNIQPGQGFWVYHTVSSPTLVIQESNKIVGGIQTAVFRTNKANMLNVSIWKEVDGVSTHMDEAVATFDNNYTKAIGAEDAKKLMNGSENISIVESNTDLSINGIALPTVGDVITLKLGNVTANTAYQLKVDATQFAAPGVQAYIKDAYLNTIVPAETVINFTATTDAVTYKDRFSIVFKSAKVVPVTTVKGNISVCPNPVTEKTFTVQMSNIAAGKYTVVMVNSLGQEVMNTTITHKEDSTTESIKMNKSLTGLYTLMLRSTDGNFVYTTELLAK